MFFNIFLVAFYASTHIATANGNVNRHVIYWNKQMSPRLATDNFVLDVQMGEFMDVICPQHSLMGITNGPRKISTFDLYNVTEDQFHQCRIGSRKNFIFACDRPERENKLTIKFQTISPSPLGFRFQYCQDYYFVATTRGHRTKPGCHKDVTRLRISVGCKETTTTTITTTTTTSTFATTSQSAQPNKDLLNRVLDTTERNYPVIDNDSNSSDIPNVVNRHGDDESVADLSRSQQSMDLPKDDKPSSASFVKATSIYLLVLLANLVICLFMIT